MPRIGMISGADITLDTRAAAALERQDWDRWDRDSDLLAAGHPALSGHFAAALVSHLGRGVVASVRLDRAGRTILWMLVSRRFPGLFELFAPPQAPYGLVLADPHHGLNLERLIDTALASLPGFALLFRVKRQHETMALGGTLSQPSPRVGVSQAPTARVAISGTFDAYWKHAARPSQEIARKLRAVKQTGHHATLREVREGTTLTEAIEQHAELESRGWKGARGTAIVGGSDAGRFYRSVLRARAHAGQAAVYQLCMDGQVVASQITLEKTGILALLKTAYDEQYARFSPGRLLDYLMFQSVFAQGRIRLIDFCNHASTDDCRWATEVCALRSATLFRWGALRRVVAVTPFRNRLRARMCVLAGGAIANSVAALDAVPQVASFL